MKYETIKDAATAWGNNFNAIKTDMIKALMEQDIDSWHEITRPTHGDRVYIFNDKLDGETGEIKDIKLKKEKAVYEITLDSGKEIKLKSADAFEIERDSILPMWGLMWSFGNSADDYWLEDLDGIELMSQCGFRIFEHDEWGYFFGIDGMGYSFMDEHFIPLYKARGLKWHDPKTEQEYQMKAKGYQKKRLGLQECWYDGDKFIEEVIE